MEPSRSFSEAGSGRATGLHASLHSSVSREWTEPHLHASQLVYPLFVTLEAEDKPIAGFSPNMQWGVGDGAEPYPGLIKHLRELGEKGLRSVMLFGVVKDKDPEGSMAAADDTPVIVATKAIRAALPEMLVMCDVCMCEYTSHGHCGVLREVAGDHEDVIDNERTIDILADVALAYAQAGAEYVCPSDMMDGRIHTIREKLDQNGFRHVGVMAYTSKKASTMYSPFRAAVDSTFTGHRKRYQQPVGSILHARQALARDESEGASVVLVKPALFYGDIIKEYAQRSVLPIACYIVSGEYVMLQDYAKRAGDLESVLKESHVGLLRAGASILITYFTPELLDMIPKWR
ncbi:Delta-aminolevulinic acid dehydratase [Hondaea fermentalgiana]|uniref:porphobilinogen synthase n=1 Tax=Hondaea fermentalgiana TaxID=2315210 RepID=A0A2R5GB39_9STRA|nr:Delta-aminolevulinic acid dehydratase [Hondaea fermentalgiana]|eukprot:GBG28226.1 Delta-aminolevulinic acid dehydratase [Hondaea fermentalgiana]